MGLAEEEEQRAGAVASIWMGLLQLSQIRPFPTIKQLRGVALADSQGRAEGSTAAAVG